ncbi:hypothetical protein LTR72_011917 [Exophiala xenobiotica]|nr:hypothetical protein LTR72_011917 [Exophiala xenobiotica]KAK5461888.1 hypothetical protein LTR55_011864 [Exophiala xenobiotica]
MSTALIDQFDELPRIKGPKLQHFKDSHHKRIEYLELLRRSDDEGQLPNGGHGYVFRVRIDGELYALKIFNITDWNRPEEELSWPPAKRQPLRALVKDLVETDPEITEKLIASILQELKALNSLRIYVMDVRWSNYEGGHLVDFSSAWTEPHFEFRKDVNSEEDIKINRQIDMAAFDKMAREELDKVLLVRTGQNPDSIARLRPRRKRQCTHIVVRTH